MQTEEFFMSPHACVIIYLQFKFLYGIYEDLAPEAGIWGRDK